MEYVHKLPNAVPIIVDNNSSYPPLLDWFHEVQSDIRIVRHPENVGHRVAWLSGTIVYGNRHRRRFGSDYYVQTDYDLDLNNCPLDVLDVLIGGYQKFKNRPPYVVKAGVGLEVNDIPPDAIFSDLVLEWERKFWMGRLDDRFFNAGIDTTFAIYHCDNPIDFTDDNYHNAVRSDRPYVARHVPWYYTMDNLTDEIRYYYSHIKTLTHWSHRISKMLGYEAGFTADTNFH